MKLMWLSALMIGVAIAVARASQQGPPRLSPEAEELQKRFPIRIRDVRQGPDGLLYLLTDEDAAALLRIEPAEQKEQE
jgi:aldose sugar dehydrogenase